MCNDWIFSIRHHFLFGIHHHIFSLWCLQKLEHISDTNHTHQSGAESDRKFCVCENGLVIYKMSPDCRLPSHFRKAPKSWGLRKVTHCDSIEMLRSQLFFTKTHTYKDRRESLPPPLPYFLLDGLFGLYRRLSGPKWRHAAAGGWKAAFWFVWPWRPGRVPWFHLFEGCPCRFGLCSLLCSLFRLGFLFQAGGGEQKTEASTKFSEMEKKSLARDLCSQTPYCHASYDFFFLLKTRTHNKKTLPKLISNEMVLSMIFVLFMKLLVIESSLLLFLCVAIYS